MLETCSLPGMDAGALPLAVAPWAGAPADPPGTCGAPLDGDAGEDGGAPAAAALVPATMVVAITSDYMRLYDFDHVRTGDRTARTKVTFDERCAAAFAFDSPSGPGVVCLTARGNLHVYSLPGLAVLHQGGLDEVLGAPWAGGGDSSWLQGLAVSAAVAPEGELSLFGPFGGVARVALVWGAAWLAPGARLLDWDLERATRAAFDAEAVAATTAAASKQRSAAVEAAAREREPNCGASGSSSPADGAPQAKRGAEGRARKGFTNFLSNVVTKVVDAGQDMAETLNKSVATAHTALGTLVHKDAAVAAAEPPALAKLFAQKPPDEPLAKPPAWDPPQGQAAAAGVTRSGSLQPTGMGAAMQQLPRRCSTALDGLPRRSEASSSAAACIAAATRATGTDGRARARTAEEIRAAYGFNKDGSSRAERVAGVMTENAELLAQRGEKLQQLQNNTAALQEDAMSFADAANRLQQEARKKWWQL